MLLSSCLLTKFLMNRQTVLFGVMSGSSHAISSRRSNEFYVHEDMVLLIYAFKSKASYSWLQISSDEMCG